MKSRADKNLTLFITLAYFARQECKPHNYMVEEREKFGSEFSEPYQYNDICVQKLASPIGLLACSRFFTTEFTEAASQCQRH